MAKGKKNISDFESALLNNTKIIKSSSSEMLAKDVLNEENLDLENIINPILIGKYKELAFREGVEFNDLITLALEHFLNMETIFFEK